MTKKRTRSEDPGEPRPPITETEAPSAEEDGSPAMAPKANEADLAAQRIEERSEGDKIVRNSPYGAERVVLGWGNVFSAPIKCFFDAAPQVFIGTSSLNCVPAKQREMPQMLQVYMKKFNVLEHCATYHRINEQTTWEKWRAMPGKKPFLFTVKANEWFTHMKMLEMDEETMSHINTFFVSRCAALGDRLAAVLIQLPPQFKCTEVTMDRIRTVAAAIPPHINIAVEFRNKSWFKQEVYNMLAAVRWTLVATHNEDIGESPLVDTGTNIMYVRLHGAVSRFVGDYGPTEMRRWAERVHDFVSKDPVRRRVYLFLNNNESHVNHETSSVVDATCLAQELRQIVTSRPFGVGQSAETTKPVLSDPTDVAPLATVANSPPPTAEANVEVVVPVDESKVGPASTPASTPSQKGRKRQPSSAPRQRSPAGEGSTSSEPIVL